MWFSIEQEELTKEQMQELEMLDYDATYASKIIPNTLGGGIWDDQIQTGGYKEEPEKAPVEEAYEMGDGEIWAEEMKQQQKAEARAAFADAQVLT